MEDGYGKQAQCQRNQRRNGQTVRRETTQQGAKESELRGAPRALAGSVLDLVRFLAPDSIHWQPGRREAASAGGDPGAYSPTACSRNANEAKNKCSTSKRLSHRQSVGRCQRHGAPGGAYASRRLAAPRVCTHVPGWRQAQT